LRGLRVAARADDETTVRNLGWFVRTLEPPGSLALVGGPRADALLPALRAAVSGLDLELLPEACPVEITASAAPAWRSSTAVVGLATAAGADVDPPLIEFEIEGGVPRATGERHAIVRAVAPWAGTTAALLLATGVLDGVRLHRRERQLEAAALKVYRGVVPDAKKGPGLRIKMEARANELERRLQESAGAGPSATPLAVLADMSAAVPADLQVEFDLYAFDPPSARLRGRSQSFEAVTRLQEILTSSGRFAAVEVSDVRAAVNEGVEFELTLKVGSGDPAA
jgi:hypothetical protein